MERERPVTPDQCKEYYTEMATFYMACAQRMDFDLSIMTKWFGHSEQELLELKKFLVLKSAKQDIGTVPMMSPSVKIEQMWNDFLKFPGLYHKFCYDLVIMKSQRNENGYTEITQYNIIDHVLLCDPIHTNATFNATLREYERFFEYSPPGEIWSNPFSSEEHRIEEHRNVIASPQLVVASTEEMPSRSYNISKKRLGFLPKEEEEEDEIMKWSQQYDEDKKREMESSNVKESSNNNDVKIKTNPRFGVKISSSGGGKRGRSNSIAADEQSIRRTRSNSVTSVSSSEEVIANGKHAKDKKKKKLIVTKEPGNKKRNHNDNPNNGRIVTEKQLYYCLENDTCVTICSSLTIDGGVDELIRLNSPYNGVKVTKKTKFKAGTALRINESVENPGATQSN